ncbi:MAG TPA: hypothetical protein DCY35_05820 [Prolixibacteraceae bacterium]|nr:hypothetical protein [Prolixibacteraceae bacterium]
MFSYRYRIVFEYTITIQEVYNNYTRYESVRESLWIDFQARTKYDFPRDIKKDIKTKAALLGQPFFNAQ